MTLYPEPVDPREAGAILKKARNKLGLTQGQVIDAVGIPNQSYLSALENGRYNVANSEYLPALAQLLKLTIEEVKAINPAAVIQVAAPEPEPSSRALSAGSKYRNIPRKTPEVPDALREAAELYGHLPIYKELRDPAVQEWMVGSASRKFTPTTVEGWLAEFSDLKRLGYIGGPEGD